MEPISLLPENYILLGRKKVGLTYRWLFTNEKRDLKRKRREAYGKWMPRKEVPKGRSFYDL